MDRLSTEILIASNNKGKIREISSLLSKLKIKTITPKSLECFANLVEPEEDGDSFQENSLIKACFYAKKSGMTSLADDSGFCIPDLNNEPGIHSARFALNKAGEKDFPSAFRKIFSNLALVDKNPNQGKIPAYFVCNLTIYDPVSNFSKSFEGRVNGALSAPKGEKGFGYDPIFIEDSLSKTFGEIEPAIKDKISHRGKAFELFEDWLKKII